MSPEEKDVDGRDMPGHDEKFFRQRDVYHFHARAIYQRFRISARTPANPCVWRAGITG